MGSIQFLGDPPFGLILGQSPAVKAEGGSVILTLHVTLPGEPPVPVDIEVNSATARSLARRLSAEADQADKQIREF